MHSVRQQSLLGADIRSADAEMGRNSFTISNQTPSIEAEKYPAPPMSAGGIFATGQTR